MTLQFDIERMNLLKYILRDLRHGDTAEVTHTIKTEFSDVRDNDFLLTMQDLLHREEDITPNDIEWICELHPSLSQREDPLTPEHPGHPVNIFFGENKTFRMIIEQMRGLMEQLENDLFDTSSIQSLKRLTFKLGACHKHFHRKEKLFFPIMERYGYYNPVRMMWRDDDRIRALYQGVKRQITQLPQIDFKHVQIVFDKFAAAFKSMLFQENKLILPVLLNLFQHDDWRSIAKESDAFGYVMTDSATEWEIAELCDAFVKATGIHTETNQAQEAVDTQKNTPFGGGYLTVEEANLILNNLPLEITFVDKNSVFKYFNHMTEASDMILVRTPISIGRNVANCHPPKSLHKVMTLIRDLKTRKRTSESMWFKKKDEYVHITYKALFNETDEYMGILEYVQDIQPFFNLPSEIKRGLSKLE